MAGRRTTSGLGPVLVRGSLMQRQWMLRLNYETRRTHSTEYPCNLKDEIEHSPS